MSQKAAEKASEPHCDSCTCFETPLTLEDLQRRRKAAAKKRRSGLKRDSLDATFSTMIRERDHWTCQRCLKRYEPKSQGLHCAHMYSRRIKATRLWPDNACALCFGCHQYIDSHPNEKLEFFRSILGDERFEALTAKAKARRDR